MNKKKILIVDDDEVILFLVECALRDLGPGYEVCRAHNGPAALAQLKEQSFDLLVTDYDMLGMNGFELAEAARQISPSIPIVLMTGKGNSEEIQLEAKRLNLAGCFSKAFLLTQVDEIVKCSGVQD